MILSPSGEVDCGVEVAVTFVAASAGEEPIGQSQLGVSGAALGAELT
jgi:hypothetical protein